MRRKRHFKRISVKDDSDYVSICRCELRNVNLCESVRNPTYVLFIEYRFIFNFHFPQKPLWTSKVINGSGILFHIFAIDKHITSGIFISCA